MGRQRVSRIAWTVFATRPILERSHLSAFHGQQVEGRSKTGQGPDLRCPTLHVRPGLQIEATYIGVSKIGAADDVRDGRLTAAETSTLGEMNVEDRQSKVRLMAVVLGDLRRHGDRE